MKIWMFLDSALLDYKFYHLCSLSAINFYDSITRDHCHRGLGLK